MNLKHLLVGWLIAMLVLGVGLFVYFNTGERDALKHAPHVPLLAVPPTVIPPVAPVPDPSPAPVPTVKPEPVPDVPTATASFKELDKGLRLYADIKRIEMDGKISLQRGLLELVASGPDAKEYESIITVFAQPSQLHLGLILLGLKSGDDYDPTKGPKFRGDPAIPLGDRVKVSIKWKNSEGKDVTYRAEDLVFNRRDNTTMARVGFTFLGSKIEPEKDLDTGKPTGREIYAGDIQRLIVSVFHDPTSIIENPLADGGSDELYYANETVLPVPGTDAVLIFEVPSAKELEEMLKNEPK